ncbi:MAG: helix-turn-helix transcriptional regulator [Taibaiella sp.]|nr:helix-turn-helix transcriptional regulator [Taibaiella sp.]
MKNEKFALITDCPVTVTLEFIGGRWKSIILYTLSAGTRRFGELSVRIPTISRKVLTQQLRELETHGLVKRVQFNEIPPRVEYSLTDLGLSLNKVMFEMERWGTEKGINALTSRN